MRSFQQRLFQIVLFGVGLAPTAAFAHVGVGPTSGFAPGFMHPLSGLDHLLAMTLVGLYAYRLGGRALWLLPLTFVSVMALGGFLGYAGIPVLFVETGIAISVIALGAIVAFGVKPPIAAAMALMGLFAIFHGHAHGTEMAAGVSGLEYGIGFMLATATLHGLGIGIGYLIGSLTKAHGETAYRLAGGLASIAGVLLLLGLL